MAQLRYVRVATASINQTPMDWEGNKRRIVAAIRDAKAAGVSLLCLPELCISSYTCEDMFHAVYVHEISAKILMEVLPESMGITVAISLPVSYRGGVYNAAAVISNGVLLGLAAKQHLPGDGLHYEPRWFKPWPAGERAEIGLLGQRYPFGDLLFDVGHLRFGFEICQDAWVAERTGIALAQRGVDVLLNPSASHFAFGKFKVRKRLVLEAARAFGVAYLYANDLGNSSGRIVYDGEALIAAGGTLLAQSARFSFKDWQLSVADVDIASLQMQRAKEHSYAPPSAQHLALEVHADFDYPEITDPITSTAESVPAWETSPDLKEEEFTRVQALGLFDYLWKSRSQGFVVNLSGGIDSGSVAYLVFAMLKLALADIGEAGVKQRLAYIPGFNQITTFEAMMKRLLTCVYQKTENNSATTEKAARNLAAALSADFIFLDINPLVNAYIKAIESATETQLTWARNDLALQNIQARTRGPSAWLIANIRGAVLLSTSNRSEIAVGYATLDGDTCGGFSPLAGIDKAYLTHWLKWCEEKGSEGIGPMPALADVNAQVPTAELRPLSANQTDESDLMPYRILAVLEKLAIRDKKSPTEIWRQLKVEFAEDDALALAGYVERFFALWAHSQWKRERFAPGFHVDDVNFDPKTWCRFPVLCGNFDREIMALKEAVAAQG